MDRYDARPLAEDRADANIPSSSLDTSTREGLRFDDYQSIHNVDRTARRLRSSHSIKSLPASTNRNNTDSKVHKTSRQNLRLDPARVKTSKIFSFAVDDEENILIFLQCRLSQIKLYALKKLADIHIKNLCMADKIDVNYKSGPRPKWWPWFSDHSDSVYQTSRAELIALVVYLLRLGCEPGLTTDSSSSQTQTKHGWLALLQNSLDWDNYEEWCKQFCLEREDKLAEQERYFGDLLKVLQAEYRYWQKLETPGAKAVFEFDDVRAKRLTGPMAEESFLRQKKSITERPDNNVTPLQGRSSAISLLSEPAVTINTTSSSSSETHTIAEPSPTGIMHSGPAEPTRGPAAYHIYGDGVQGPALHGDPTHCQYTAQSGDFWPQERTSSLPYSYTYHPMHGPFGNPAAATYSYMSAHQAASSHSSDSAVYTVGDLNCPLYVPQAPPAQHYPLPHPYACTCSPATHQPRLQGPEQAMPAPNYTYAYRARLDHVGPPVGTVSYSNPSMQAFLAAHHDYSMPSQHHS